MPAPGAATRLIPEFGFAQVDRLSPNPNSRIVHTDLAGSVSTGDAGCAEFAYCAKSREMTETLARKNPYGGKKYDRFESADGQPL